MTGVLMFRCGRRQPVDEVWYDAKGPLRRVRWFEPVTLTDEQIADNKMLKGMKVCPLFETETVTEFDYAGVEAGVAIYTEVLP